MRDGARCSSIGDVPCQKNNGEIDAGRPEPHRARHRATTRRSRPDGDRLTRPPANTAGFAVTPARTIARLQASKMLESLCALCLGIVVCCSATICATKGCNEVAIAAFGAMAACLRVGRGWRKPQQSRFRRTRASPRSEPSSLRCEHEQHVDRRTCRVRA